MNLAEPDYVIEMLHITKEFPGIKANDDITLQLRKGEIHALLGENGAGKSTLMSVLFGLYQPESGVIKKNGEVVHISDPNDANDLHIGMEAVQVLRGEGCPDLGGVCRTLACNMKYLGCVPDYPDTLLPYLNEDWSVFRFAREADTAPLPEPLRTRRARRLAFPG